MLYSFKLILYLDTTAISNEIKYYLTANRGNFLERQYDFYKYALLQIYYGILLKEHLPRTQEKLKRACLEHRCKRSLKLCDWSSNQVSLFLLTREAGIVNAQECDMH